MNKGTILLMVLVLVSVLSAVSVMGVECTTTFGINCTVSSDLTFNPGLTFYGNDTDGIGNIRINANDVTLDCNGATLQGNTSTGSRGIDFNFRDNITVKNCNLFNYSTGIRLSAATNGTIFNNSITNILTHGILIRAESDNTNVSYNIIMNATTTGSGKIGILFDATTKGTIIKNNIISNVYNTIKFGSGGGQAHNNTLIELNNLTNSYDFCIFTSINSNYTTINNNNLIDCDSNAIDLWGYYNTVSNNYFENYSHQGVDMFTTDATTGGFNEIFNNTFIDSSDDSNCIFITKSFNNSIYLNNCSGAKIVTEGNESLQFGNKVYNNTISNVRNSMFTTSNTLWSYNTILNPFNFTNYVSCNNAVNVSPSFKDNIYTNGIANYWINNVCNTNVTINETSTIMHNITIASTRFIKFIYPGRKDFRVENNTITINNMEAPYNDIYNVSSGSVVAFDQTSYVLNVGSNEEYWIGAYPQEDELITVNTRLLPLVYYLNDTGGDGAIIIGANDVTLDCNGASLVGNFSTGSYAIKNPQFDNITIKNCVIDGYKYGIHNDNSVNSSTIINNNISYINNTAIYFAGGSDNNISNNIINMNTTESPSFRGILLQTFTGRKVMNNNLIYGNTINGTYRPIYLQVGNGILINNTLIDGNTINNSNFTGITNQDANYTTIINNKIFNSGHNGIDLDGFYANVSYNAIDGFDHNGIDLLIAPTNVLRGGYNIIQYNNISNPVQSTSSVGILISNSIQNNVSFNIIINIFGSGTTDNGIQVDGNVSVSYGNIFFNNSINGSDYCLWEASNNSQWFNNTLSNCNTQTFFIKNFDNEVGTLNDRLVTIFNNIDLDGKFTYEIESQSMNISINETSTSFHNVTIQNNGFIKFIYNGRKDFRVENNTITINNMEAPYNDIYNVSSGLILAANQSSYTVTIGPGDEIQVGNFIPQSISSITATTTNNSINWIPTYTLASNTTGTYGIAPSYTNLGTFVNTTFLVSPILIFSNLNASQTYNFNITEFCDASANCNSTGFLFSFATDANPTAIDEARDDFMATILTLASFMSIFMLVLIIGTILLMIKNKENLNIDFFNGGIQTFIFVVMTILLTLFLIIVFGKSFG